MELQTFFYIKDKNWSVSQFPNLDSAQTLIIIFSAPEYLNNPDPIQQLIKAYPQAHIIGCSTGGEIMGPIIMDHSIVAAVIKFKTTKLSQAFAKIDSSGDSFAVGLKIAKELNSNDLQAVFVLSDGIIVNGSELVKGLNSVFPNHVTIMGGMAGDGDRFKQTWNIAQGKLQPCCVSAIGFYGDKIRIGHGSEGGWYTFGQERRITKSKNNILYELDHKPALSLYREYLGERAKELPAAGLLFPIAIREDGEDSNEVVRTILGVDETAQALIFAGDMPMGYHAKLMRANFELLIAGATNAATQAGMNQQNADPVLSIAISCIGRRLLLGEATEEETEATLYSLPKGTQQIGFYSYGEISPYKTGHCDLHNQTMTLTTISEEL